MITPKSAILFYVTGIITGTICGFSNSLELDSLGTGLCIAAGFFSVLLARLVERIAISLVTRLSRAAKPTAKLDLRSGNGNWLVRCSVFSIGLGTTAFVMSLKWKSLDYHLAIVFIGTAIALIAGQFVSGKIFNQHARRNF